MQTSSLQQSSESWWNKFSILSSHVLERGNEVEIFLKSSTVIGTSWPGEGKNIKCWFDPAALPEDEVKLRCLKLRTSEQNMKKTHVGYLECNTDFRHKDLKPEELQWHFPSALPWICREEQMVWLFLHGLEPSASFSPRSRQGTSLLQIQRS